MPCQWLIDGRCEIAGKIASRHVVPEEAACVACGVCYPPQAVNRVTVGLAAAQCANDGEGNKAIEIMADHRAIVFGQSKPFNLDPPKQATPTQLVGDALTALLREYGIKPVKSCGCDSWKQKLNEWGIDGCMSNRQAIIDHLSDAYHSSTWWQTLTAAGNAVYHSLPLTLGGMVDEAIRRTETPLGN